MRNKILLSVIVIQIIIVLVLFIPNEYKARNGKDTVVFKTIPVDPIDIMRGHYASVKYQISDIKLDESELYDDMNYEGDLSFENLKRGDSVYVNLKKKNGYYVAAGISKTHEIGILSIKGSLVNLKKPAYLDPKYTEEYNKLDKLIDNKKISEDEYNKKAAEIDKKFNVEKDEEEGRWYFKVKYGIEKIFVSEKKAKEMDFTKPFDVKVSLDSNGNPSVVSID